MFAEVEVEVEVEVGESERVLEDEKFRVNTCHKSSFLMDQKNE
jgi:hypothetical protein